MEFLVKENFIIILACCFSVSLFWLVPGAFAADRIIPGTGIVITPDGIKVDRQQSLKDELRKEREEAAREAAEEAAERAAERREEAAERSAELREEAAERSEAKKTKKKAETKGVHVKTVCPPGTTAKVTVGDNGSVKDSSVTTICEKGGSAEVSVGSTNIQDRKMVQDTVIQKNVSGTSVRTQTGKNAKTTVNVGAVNIGDHK